MVCCSSAAFRDTRCLIFSKSISDVRNVQSTSSNRVSCSRPFIGLDQRLVIFRVGALARNPVTDVSNKQRRQGWNNFIIRSIKIAI